MKKQFLTYFQLHLIELKFNFIIIFYLFIYLLTINYYFSDQLIFLFTKKLIQSNLLKYFIFTNITEMFLTNVFISTFVSIYILIHFVFIQFWFFISKGLYKNENYKILKFYLIFFVFNFFIINFILIKLIPNIWFFFIKINFSNTYLFNIYFEPKFSNYFYFIFFSFIYIYILFCYFYFFLIIISYKILEIQNIINLRKFFYLKFIFISILISPPEIITQFIIFFLLFFFFEITIFLYLIKCKYNYFN